ncbi:hypothetical protein CK222_29910, partial [Mesorhizobium sp. WSM3866]|uniref:hypothetical protein n=1 Tax=Mesorhizobium sp. WSM3866 TaxID=422271 RepID=UPI000BDDE208
KTERAFFLLASDDVSKNKRCKILVDSFLAQSEELRLRFLGRMMLGLTSQLASGRLDINWV